MLPPSRSPSVPALPCNSSPHFLLFYQIFPINTLLFSVSFIFPIHRDEPARSEPPFIYLCTHLEHRCPNRADAVRHGRTSVVKASEQRYIERAVRTSWARPVIFTTMCKKTSPDSPKAARRGIFIITNKAPASPYNDASPPASYPLPSSGGSACFSHFHPASS